MLSRHIADDHPAPLKFAPRLLRRHLPDAEAQRLGDQPTALHDRVFGKELFARVIKRPFRRDLFAHRPRFTVRGFHHHCLLFRRHPRPPRREEVRIQQAVTFRLPARRPECIPVLGVVNATLLGQFFDLRGAPRKLVDDAARNPGDFPALRCPFNAEAEGRKFGRQA